jgi:hypothetical protein
MSEDGVLLLDDRVRRNGQKNNYLSIKIRPNRETLANCQMGVIDTVFIYN